MKKWEYKSVETGFFSDCIEKLNQLGLEGWEVITHSVNGEARDTHYIILKREIVSPRGPVMYAGKDVSQGGDPH